MDELVKQVVQRTGISEDQARQAVTVVINFIKERLPAPIASQVDGFLNNPGMAAGIGGLFGQK